MPGIPGYRVWVRLRGVVCLVCVRVLNVIWRKEVGVRAHAFATCEASLIFFLLSSFRSFPVAETQAAKSFSGTQEGRNESGAISGRFAQLGKREKKLESWGLGKGWRSVTGSKAGETRAVWTIIKKPSRPPASRLPPGRMIERV